MRSLLVAAALGWSLAIPAQQLSPYELPADVAARVRAMTNGEPLRLLAAIGSMDAELRAAADEVWSKLDTRAQCALTRAGLRSRDPEIAIGAAVEATDNPSWLDAAETKRAARVGMARCNLENTPFDVADYFKLLDAEDAALLLASPGSRPREIPQFLGAMHRCFGPEHWSQVEQLAHGDDLLLRQDADYYLSFLKFQRLRYAYYLLSRPLEPARPSGDFDVMVDRLPYEPRKVTLRSPGEGYHPVLAALLEDQFLSGREFAARELTFSWRWAREQTAGEIDRALLLRLAQSDRDEARRVAVHGLARLRDGDDARAALLACTEGDLRQTVAPFLAFGELVRRGDAGARHRLAELAPKHPLALAVLWYADRDTAAGLLADLELGHVLEAADDGEFWGVPMLGLPPVLIARAAAGAFRGAELGLLLGDVPAARTPGLLRLAIAALDGRNVEAMPLGVLELGGAAALAAKLRTILAAEELSPDAFEVAAGALVRLDPNLLGDEGAVGRLWDRCGDLGSPGTREGIRLRIAAARGEAVRERALARLAAEPPAVDAEERAAALAVAVAACGADHRLADSLRYTLESNAEPAEVDAARTVMLEALRAGDGAAAIASLLAADRFGVRHLALWMLPDALALPALRRGLAQRERGEYLDAIGQLALRGDPAARTEVESAIARRLYGWIDRFDQAVLTADKGLERVPLLLSQVDSNCCTYAVIASALEDVFEVDPFVGESGALSRPERLHATWQRHRTNLRWSRIADRWLIVPK